MKRAWLFIVPFSSSFFCAPMLAAQEYDVWIELFAMAHFPLSREENFVRYPTGPSEYKRLTRWNLDKWRDRSPEYFDLVVIVQNPGALAVGPIELQLNRDVKIGEFWDFRSQPHPSEFAQWEGPIPVETKTIGTIEANEATAVWFGPFSADELWENLWAQDLWPWEVKYQVTPRCSDCSPTNGSTSFDMNHPH